MKLSIRRVKPLIPKGVFLQWVIEQPTESGVFTFQVERAGGPLGAWSPVLSATPAQYAVLDDFRTAIDTPAQVHPNLLTLNQRLFYRVSCTTPSGNVLRDIQELDVTSHQTPADLKVAQLRRKARLDFARAQRYPGTPILLLKRRWWGETCMRCRDPRTKALMRTDCTSCWSTGFLGGYWNPVEVRGRRSVANVASQITPEGKSDSAEAKFWLPESPQVERDDVLILLEEGRRYRIDQQVQTEMQLQGVHQVVNALAIASDHLLYRMPYDTTSIAPFY